VLIQGIIWFAKIGNWQEFILIPYKLCVILKSTKLIAIKIKLSIQPLLPLSCKIRIFKSSSYYVTIFMCYQIPTLFPQFQGVISMTDIINNVQEFKSCWVQKIVDLSQTNWTGPKLMQFARYRPCMVSVNDKVRFTFKKN
jgi:hypothetical protein